MRKYTCIYDLYVPCRLWGTEKTNIDSRLPPTRFNICISPMKVYHRASIKKNKRLPKCTSYDLDPVVYELPLYAPSSPLILFTLRLFLSIITKQPLVSPTKRCPNEYTRRNGEELTTLVRRKISFPVKRIINFAEINIIDGNSYANSRKEKHRFVADIAIGADPRNL